MKSKRPLGSVVMYNLEFLVFLLKLDMVIFIQLRKHLIFLVVLVLLEKYDRVL